MAKLIVNKELELNGKITVKRTLEDGELVIIGSLATHYYLEEIISLETDRFIIDKIEVFEEVFGSDDFDILYNFKAKILKVKGISNLSVEELKKIENIIYKSNGIVKNSTLDFGGDIDE